jgi:hypothetical protein
MKHEIRQLGAVDLDSGQHEDLQEIIERLRKDIIVSNNGGRGVSPEGGDERADSSRGRKSGDFRRRAAEFNTGPLGVIRRIPA